MRVDLQQLRAVAVVVVILNHLGARWVPGGFLGVDLFFVVSGYVITRSMLLDPSLPSTRAQFFLRFWVRRAFRLWPMLFATVIAITGISILTDLIPQSSLLTGTASLFGASNIWLLERQMEYFSLDASRDWFMHTWSLAVEEQIYLLLSLTFAILGGSRIQESHQRRSALLKLLVVMTLVSAFLAISANEILRFYSMQTRFYQVGVGTVIALLPTSQTLIKRNYLWSRRALVFIGLGGIMILFLVQQRPGVYGSLIVSALSGMVIWGTNHHQRTCGFISSQLLNRIGDRSYALYLVHWPCQRFADATMVNGLARTICSLCLTVVISFAGFRWIESPTRHRWRALRLRNATAIALVGLLLMGAIMFSSYTYMQRSIISSKRDPASQSVCTRSVAPNWVIGDSHLGVILHEIAMAFDGNCKLVGEIGFNVLFDSSVIGNVREGQVSRSVSLRNIDRLNSEIRISKPRVVLVTHFLTGLMSSPDTAQASANWVAIEWQDQEGRRISRELFLSKFELMLRDLTQVVASNGGTLIVSSPPPDFNWLSEPNDTYSNFDFEILCDRGFTSTTHVRIVSQCEIWRKEAEMSRAEYLTRSVEIHRILNDMQHQNKSFVHFQIGNLFCSSFLCSNFKNGEPVYLDDDHVNFRGAHLIGVKFQSLLVELGLRAPSTRGN